MSLGVVICKKFKKKFKIENEVKSSESWSSIVHLVKGLSQIRDTGTGISKKHDIFRGGACQGKIDFF